MRYSPFPQKFLSQNAPQILSLRREQKVPHLEKRHPQKPHHNPGPHYWRLAWFAGHFTTIHVASHPTHVIFPSPTIKVCPVIREHLPSRPAGNISGLPCPLRAGIFVYFKSGRLPRPSFPLLFGFIPRSLLAPIATGAKVYSLSKTNAACQHEHASAAARTAFQYRHTWDHIPVEHFRSTRLPTSPRS